MTTNEVFTAAKIEPQKVIALGFNNNCRHCIATGTLTYDGDEIWVLNTGGLKFAMTEKLGKDLKADTPENRKALKVIVKALNTNKL